MSVSVPFSFVPPTNDDITELVIYESSQPSSGFYQIDSTTDVGTYPNYITYYVTKNANSANDWFAIQWVDSSGYATPISSPMQGGTRSLVGEIQQRVYVRDASFNEIEVVEEAEYVISYCFDTTDPYSINILDVTPMWLTGLSRLTLLALLYMRAIQNSTLGSYSAGMISESGGSGSIDGIEKFWRRTLAQMGIGGSRIAEYENHRGHRRLRVIQEIDVSRLLSTRTEHVTRVLVEDMPSGFVISRRDHHR